MNPSAFAKIHFQNIHVRPWRTAPQSNGTVNNAPDNTRFTTPVNFRLHPRIGANAMYTSHGVRPVFR